MTKLNEACVAILATDGYQQDELLSPAMRLKKPVPPSTSSPRKPAKSVAGWMATGPMPSPSTKPWRKPTPKIMTHWCCPAAC